MLRQHIYFFAVALVAPWSLATVCDAAPLRAGDIVVADDLLHALFRVDPVTGDRSILSKATGPDAVGNGPELGSAQQIAIDKNGFLFVTTLTSTIVRVDPATGDRTYVTSETIGTGPRAHNLYGIAIDASGSLYASADDGRDSILRIDPVSGNRTTISASDVGAGPQFGVRAAGLTFNRAGELFAADLSGRGGVVHVDTLSGDRTVVSGGYSDIGGPGPRLSDLFDLEFDGDGNLYALASYSLYTIDPVTGRRSILNGGAIGSGFPVSDASGIAVLANGNLVVTSGRFKALLQVDPTTGAASILSNGYGFQFLRGDGPSFVSPTGVLVVPAAIPEPASATLTWVGGLAIWTFIQGGATRRGAAARLIHGRWGSGRARRAATGG